MDFLFDRHLTRFGAALLSGALFYFTLGLHPVWPLAWIAPVPLLLAAFHASRREARLLAVLASFLGLTSLFPYYFQVLNWFVFLVLVLLQVLAWAFLVLFTRAIVLRSDHWFTVFAFPLACAGFDTLISAFSPHGTFGSLAYTQMNVLPVIQIASLTGTPGIVFVISLFASALALAFYRVRPRRAPLLAYGLPLLLILGVVAWGALRLTKSGTADKTVPIGMVAIDDFLGPKIPRAKADAVWHGYDAAIARLAQEGARIVVLPEKIDVQEPAAATRRAALAALARRHDIYLVAGVGLTTEDGWKNRAWLFDPKGELLAAYDKQYLVPGLEAAMSAGHENAVREIDGARFGIAICKDMHFAQLGRSYGKERVAAMIEPAWDFFRDGWMASRIAALRGVENGYAVVHSSRESILSASDRYGRFVAQMPSRELPGAAVIAQVPIAAPSPTFYARFGDWFGWLCVIGAVAIRFTGSG